jgi:hypothetical protein
VSVPNPATTDWVPISGGMNLDYLGAYSSATTYYDGDIVVGPDGVIYMCVTDNTVNIPPSWPAAYSLSQQVSARVYRSTVQSIPNATWTAVSFDTVSYDNGGQWSVGVPTRLTCQQAGTYVISGHIALALVAGGAYRAVGIYLNGTIQIALTDISNVTLVAAGQPLISVSTVVRLQAGDYIELKVYQDSGAALASGAGDSGTLWYASDLSMSLVAGPKGDPGVGVPTPVVNGQWIKGAGSSAVWSAITQADLPTNLQAAAASLPGSDYNNAIASGWYVATPTDANRPANIYAHVQVFQFGGPQYKQVAQQYNSLDRWERVYVTGSGWSTWTQTQFTPDRTWTSLSMANGWGAYGAPFALPRFRKTANGMVSVQGLISRAGGNPGQNVSVATLPAGYRPGMQVMFACTCSGSNVTDAVRVDVDAAGNMPLTVGSISQPWVYMSIDVIQFYAEN